MQGRRSIQAAGPQVLQRGRFPGTPRKSGGKEGACSPWQGQGRMGMDPGAPAGCPKPPAGLGSQALLSWQGWDDAQTVWSRSSSQDEPGSCASLSFWPQAPQSHGGRVRSAGSPLCLCSLAGSQESLLWQWRKPLSSPPPSFPSLKLGQKSEGPPEDVLAVAAMWGCGAVCRAWPWLAALLGHDLSSWKTEEGRAL